MPTSVFPAPLTCSHSAGSDGDKMKTDNCVLPEACMLIVCTYSEYAKIRLRIALYFCSRTKLQIYFCSFDFGFLACYAAPDDSRNFATLLFALSPFRHCIILYKYISFYSSWPVSFLQNTTEPATDIPLSNSSNATRIVCAECADRMLNSKQKVFRRNKWHTIPQ